MKLRLLVFPAAVVLLFLVAFAAPPAAATQAHLAPMATMQLNREPGGDIDAGPPATWDGAYENTNGAMVWNGTAWVVNSTWAHTYFTDANTGTRLIVHAVAGSFDGSGAPNSTVVKGYTVTQVLYSYSIPAAAGGDFRYEAVEYRITQPDTKRLIVRSRGCGLGVTGGYLDVYIDDPVAGVHVAALRGDPVMYVYDASFDEALGITDETQGAFASLPTYAPEGRARYWLDVNGGSDMTGYSYVLRTQSLACRTHNLGTACVSEFQIQFYDAQTNTVQELRFLPRLLSETPPVTPTPTATASRTATVTPSPTASATSQPLLPVYLPLVSA